MSLHTVYYEFEVTEKLVRQIVEDLGITQSRAPAVLDVAQNLIDMIDFPLTSSAKVEYLDRPGLLLRFAKNFSRDTVPHPFEGAHATIHPSSEGYLMLSEFENGLEACLSARRIHFKKYD